MLETQRAAYSTCGFVVANHVATDPQLLELERKVTAMRVHIDNMWKAPRFNSAPASKDEAATGSDVADAQSTWSRFVANFSRAFRWLPVFRS